MFGRASTSKLPVLNREDASSVQTECHIQAREHHKANADAITRQFDKHMKARECKIRVGDEVLLKRDVTRKDMSPWYPDPFRVISMNGSLVTVQKSSPKHQCLLNKKF